MHRPAHRNDEKNFLGYFCLSLGKSAGAVSKNSLSKRSTFISSGISSTAFSTLDFCSHENRKIVTAITTNIFLIDWSILAQIVGEILFGLFLFFG